MAKKLFRGPDSDKINMSIRVLQDLQNRDVRALNPKRTTSISTRTLVFDNPNVTPHPITDAVNAVLTALTAARIATTSS